MLYDIILPFLWSIPITMRISLDMILLKCTFHMGIDSLKTPYNLTKNNVKAFGLLEGQKSFYCL